MKRFDFKEHDHTTHYQCTGCGELFSDRYEGTVILTACKNVRLIGPEKECISVWRFINDDTTDPTTRPHAYEQRSPRFHSSECFINTINDIKNLTDVKFADPSEEDIQHP